jgi:putative drug exporter of the RND superfamily
VFVRLGHTVVRRRRLILALTGVFVAVAAVAGVNVFERLGRRGFDDPGSESYRARQILEDELRAGDPDVVLLVDAGEAGVDDPAVVSAGEALTDELASEDSVASAVSYWSLGGASPLRDDAGREAIVLVDLTGTEREVADAATAIIEDRTGRDGPLTIGVGGREAVAAAITDQVQVDLAKAEGIAVPATLVLLVVVFGGLLAAALPMAVAFVALIGTFLALFLVALVTDVSVFSINLTTALGLGLSIDYSLFIVNRFREELGAGRSTEAALVRTMETAGRTVAFSALTVAVSLAALLVFPLYFLRSFAYAGTAVVVLAAAGSLFSLPALLAVVGPRVDAGRIARRRRASRAPEGGFWHRLATTVMRRPVLVATVVVALLLVLAAPFLRVEWGLPSYLALPASSEVRQTSDRLTREFVGNRGDQFSIVVTDDHSPSGAALERFRVEVEDVDGVASAALQQNDAGAWITVVPDVVLRSADGETLVHELRDLDAPFSFGVTGPAAELVDAKSAIFGRLPAALAIIGVATALLLFALFGSVLVPVKAIAMNLLSLTATFGAMVWIFQDGHLSGLLDFTPTGQLDVAVPILTFCIAFGLSMDYEVFLLSRIKEEHDRTGDNTAAVAAGLERTGRIVTAAAGVLAVTFLAVSTSSVTFIKMFGLGMTLAVLMDATVIRGLLVPAFMRLAGEANWWAPAPLRRWHERWGLREGEHASPEANPEGDGDDVDDREPARGGVASGVDGGSPRAAGRGEGAHAAP